MSSAKHAKSQTSPARNNVWACVSKRAKIWAIVAVVAAILLEIILSNAVFLFTLGGGDKIGYATQITVIDKDNSSIVFTDVDSAVNSVAFDAVYVSDEPNTNFVARFDLYIYTDTATDKDSALVLEKEPILIGTDGSCRNSIFFGAVSGNITKVVISFDDTSNSSFSPFAVSKVCLNEPYSFSFNFLRAVIFIIIALLIWAGVVFGWSRSEFDSKNVYHRAAYIAVVGILLIVFVFWAVNMSGSSEPVEYPLTKGIGSYNPYIQTFDAFMKGQLNIDMKPSDTLQSLENPYDRDARREAGVEYEGWDRAYYNGNFYSYFGIAPIITVYAPWYLFTGELPSDAAVASIYVFITVAFTLAAILQWAKHNTRRLPVPVLCVGALAAVISSFVFLVARGNNRFYYTAVLSGMAFTAMFAFFAITAANAKEGNNVFRRIMWALAGVSYALLMLARMNMALLLAFAVVPVLIFRIFRKDGKWKKISEMLPDIACIGIPVIIAMAFTMWYNAARFGSILEFGTKYQLTVSDISLNKLSFGNILPSIFHYFLQPFCMGSKFPYFWMMRTDAAVYSDASFGLFAIPLMLALFGGIVVLVRKKVPLYHKILFASSAVGLFVVALLNYSIGGVIFRYSCDLTLFAAMMSVFVIFELNGIVREQNEITVPNPKGKGKPSLVLKDRYPAAASRAVSVGSIVICLASVLVCTLVGVSMFLHPTQNQTSNLVRYSQSIYNFLKNLF